MSNNLKTIRERKGISIKFLASKLGITRQSLWRYEKGASIPLHTLDELARFFIVQPSEIVEEAEDFSNQEKEERDINIPFYDVKASAGSGSIIDESNFEKSLISFKETFFQKLNENPKDLLFVQVHGNSMLPTLKNNDFIMVNRCKTDLSIHGNGIYLMSEGNHLKVKRIHYNPYEKHIKIISDNKSTINGEREYPDYIIKDKEELDMISVAGKVVWASWGFPE